MNRLSNRLLHIAAQVQPADMLADVGCDHGYLPIYLIKNGCIRRAVAMDIGEGPLQRACAHIAEEQLENYIQTRLSNGLERLQPGEADAVVIAGMGGNLIMDILSRGDAVVRSLDQLVIEPQSELAGVRRFLRDDAACAQSCGLELSVTDAYGCRLLMQRHPVLAKYLQKEHAQCEQILRGLPDAQTGGARIAQRRDELYQQIARNEAAQTYMKAGNG